MEPRVTRARSPALLLPLEMLTVLEARGVKPAPQASAPASFPVEPRACGVPLPTQAQFHWGSLASSELSEVLAACEQRCPEDALPGLSLSWRHRAGLSCCLASSF